MRKRYIECIMSCLLLLSFFYLSSEAAKLSISIAQKDVVIEKKKKTILIDPGHGGMDPGMIGIDEIQEKDINLEIALELKSRLEEEGFLVLLTREEDCGLYDDDCRQKKAQDMQRRVERIRSELPDLAISIHQNSYEEPNVCGPQVFYYIDSSEGKKAAEQVQKELNGISNVLRAREIKGNKTYYLLKRSPQVTLIIECGFLTNPEEAELLQTEEYQKAIAVAIKRGICSYFNE